MHTVSLDLQNMTCDKTTLQKLANRLASLKGDVSQIRSGFSRKIVRSLQQIHLRKGILDSRTPKSGLNMIQSYPPKLSMARKF